MNIMCCLRFNSANIETKFQLAAIEFLYRKMDDTYPGDSDGEVKFSLSQLSYLQEIGGNVDLLDNANDSLQLRVHQQLQRTSTQ